MSSILLLRQNFHLMTPNCIIVWTFLWERCDETKCDKSTCDKTKRVELWRTKVENFKKNHHFKHNKNNFHTFLKCLGKENKMNMKTLTFLFHSILYYCFYFLTWCQKPIRTFVLCLEKNVCECLLSKNIIAKMKKKNVENKYRTLNYFLYEKKQQQRNH